MFQFLNLGIEKLKDKRDAQLIRKEQQLNKLSDEEILSELKNKQLPTFGTKQERLDRLKKFHGKKNTPREGYNYCRYHTGSLKSGSYG